MAKLTDNQPRVGIVMGSANDAETLLVAKKILDQFGIGCEVRALSAHRTPADVSNWASTAEDRGLEIIIAAAGMAAHLAGVVAAHTKLPVLGVPVAGGVLDGLDSLLSTVQMPKGTPVATFAVGAAGAANAALFAVRCLSLRDQSLREKLDDYLERQVQEVLERDFELQSKLG